MDYLDLFCSFSSGFCDEVIINFISDIEDNSYFHYKEQPRSMLFRKLKKFFIRGERGTEDPEDYE